MKRIIETAALAAIAEDVEHNCLMLSLSDEESAEDDIGFFVPRIKRAAYELRKIIEESEPEQGEYHEQEDNTGGR